MSHRYDYEVHPVAAIFQELTGPDFQKLKRDIEQQGQREAIVIEGDVLLDGRNRLRACQQLGIEPKIRQREPGEGKSAGDFIWSMNVTRRHLTDDQRAMIAMKFADATKAEAQKRSLANLKKGEQNPERADSPTRERTRQVLAEKAKVSEHKIRQAEVVAAGASELVEKVSSGQMKLKDAEKAAQRKPDKPQRSHYIAPRAAVDAVMEELQKHIDRTRKTFVQPQEHCVYNTLCADHLEVIANELRTLEVKPESIT